MTVKEQIMELLDRLPENCTIDEVLYHLYVMHAVQAGLDDADAGRIFTHEDVAAELRRKWQLSDAS